MSEETTIASIDDIYQDLESTNRARDRLADFFARKPEVVGDGGLCGRSRAATRGGAQPGVGHRLISRCPADTRKRYGSLLHFEEKARPQEDYSILIAAACQIVEAELDQLLTVPAFAIAAGLASALRPQAKDRKQAEILERWAAQEVPTTIGIQVTVLLALRRGCEQGVVPVVEFLAEHFLPRYVELLTSKKLAACLDTIRRVYRNPASHGAAAFGEQAYEHFVRLVLAQRRFAAWDAFGPTPAEPSADVGVFHHHLSLSRRRGTPAAADEAAAAPLAIADTAIVDPADAEELRPMPMQVLAERLREQVRASNCPVRVCVAVATAPGPHQPFTQVLQSESRDEGPGQAVEAVTGQLIRYEVTADTEGYLTVLNFGVEGKVEMFLPQDPRTSHRVVPGQAAKLITALAPPVGKEFTAAIWTRRPSRLSADEWQERLEVVERGQVLVLAESDRAEDWTAVVVPVVQRAGDR
jgi:hypothetical protein